MVYNNYPHTITLTFIFLLFSLTISAQLNDSITKTNDRYMQSNNFYDSLKIKAGKRSITKSIYDALINTPSKPIEQNKAYNQEIQNYFDEYTGMTIGNIDIIRLNVYTRLPSDSISILSWVQRTVNKTHIKTRNYVIKNSLTIKNGDKFNPVILDDNERLLRQLNFIRDVKIYVIPDSINSNYVNLVVITQDQWSRGFDLGIDDINAGNFSVYDYNLFGQGQSFETKIYWDTDYKPITGYGIFYKIKNIKHTFINSSVDYYKTNRKGNLKLNISRNFYTPQTKYAGGLQIGKYYLYQDIEFLDTLYNDHYIKYNYYDAWFSRAFLINKNIITGVRKRIIISGRYRQYYYFNRPQIYPNALYNYHNRSVIVGSIAYSWLNYRKTNMVYNFGRTEDIPYGFLLELQSGNEFGQYYNRLYSSIVLKYGNFFERTGFINNSLTFGSFFNNKLEQGVIKYDFEYISKLYSMKNYHFRQFIHLDYTKGINRFVDEYITINDKYGITGLKSEEMRGIQKLTFNFESLCFSPLFLYGFRFIFFGFYDGGFISFKNNMISKNNYYSGIGFGLRLRNEHLVLNTFQLRFSFYPKIPPDADPNWINVSGEEYKKFRSMEPEIPAIINY